MKFKKLKMSTACSMRTTASTLCLLGSMTPSYSVLAQEAPNLSLEEVVVTARKQDESLMDVPLAVTALSSDDMEKKGVTQFKDMVAFTPGFTFSEFSVGRGDRSNRVLVMRGMRVPTENDHQQAALAFVDGAPTLGGVISGLEDAERIEVIRGPQSAYFGRSTFSGAVNVVTKNPGNEFAGKVTSEVAQYGTSNFGVQYEGPIVEDKLSFRVAASNYTTDGQYNAAGSNTKLGERESFNIAGTFYATPTENFSAKLRFHHWQDSDGPGTAVGYGAGNGESLYNCNLPNATVPAVNGSNNLICGTVPEPTNAQIQGDYTVDQSVQNLLDGIPSAGYTVGTAFVHNLLDGFGLEREATQINLNMDYVLPNDMTISTITAHHTNRWQALDDLDRRNTDGQGAADTSLLNGRDLEDFFQEIRISSSPDSAISWMLGASYSSAEGVRTSGFVVTDAVRSFGIGNTFETETTGYFGSIGYYLTDEVKLSVEARYQADKVSEALSDGTQELSNTFESFTPRVILDYKPTDDITLYASYAEGVLPGQFNPSLVGLPGSVLAQVSAQTGVALAVPEETLKNYEIGMKARLWDNRINLSTALYKSDWSTNSRAVATATMPDGSQRAFSLTSPGGQIDLWGMEVEGKALITENFSIEATFSLNDSEYVKFTDSTAALLLGDGDVSGNEIGGTPRTQGSASFVWEDYLTGDYDWYARADYVYTGSKYMSAANITETGASKKINLRAGVESDDIRLEAFVTNLTDDRTLENLQYLLDFSAVGSGQRLITGGLAQKRTVGVRVSYHF